MICQFCILFIAVDRGATLVLLVVGLVASQPNTVPWKGVDGALMGVSVGQAGIWGVNTNYNIYYRIGTYNQHEEKGSKWNKVPGKC